VLRILLTGSPGCGKTTAARAALELLRAAGIPVGGFVTEERRGADGQRFAFEVVAVDGPRRTMSHVDWDTGVQVGRYNIDVAAFEAVALPALQRAAIGDGIVVVDELGMAQLSSARFVDVLTELLDGTNPILATVHTKPHPVTDAIKARRDVEVITVTQATRDALPFDVATRFIG